MCVCVWSTSLHEFKRGSCDCCATTTHFFSLFCFKKISHIYNSYIYEIGCASINLTSLHWCLVKCNLRAACGVNSAHTVYACKHGHMCTHFLCVSCYLPLAFSVRLRVFSFAPLKMYISLQFLFCNHFRLLHLFCRHVVSSLRYAPDEISLRQFFSIFFLLCNANILYDELRVWNLINQKKEKSLNLFAADYRESTAVHTKLCWLLLSDAWKKSDKSV